MGVQFKLAWVNLSHQYFCWVFLSPNNFLVRPHRSLRPTYINQLVNFPIAGNWHKILHLHGCIYENVSRLWCIGIQWWSLSSKPVMVCCQSAFARLNQCVGIMKHLFAPISILLSWWNCPCIKEVKSFEGQCRANNALKAFRENVFESDRPGNLHNLVQTGDDADHKDSNF